MEIVTEFVVEDDSAVSWFFYYANDIQVNF